MCFDIHDRHRAAKTAKKDVTCYKTLEKDRTSVHQNFKYRIGKLYRQPSKLHVFAGEINAGFHSYSSMSMLKRKMSWNDDNLRSFKCVIPKGSTYYFNPSRHEYESDSIRVTNEKIDKPWWR